MTAPTLPATKPTPLSGIYQGKMKITAGIALTLIFTVTTKGNEVTSTLAVPEQGGKPVPVTQTTVSGDAVTFAMSNIGATFAGTRSADGATISGTFTQSGRNFPVTLSKTNKPLVYERPQDPRPPFPYRTEDVSYPNPKAPGVTLAGTLIIPPGKAPFPVVLFITGSGPQDRNEEILGHRPFWVIADYLARRGIASLRVDDRGVAKSTGDFRAATTADFATDTRAGVAYLLTRRDVVDTKHIGLIGHSEGGVIAPMVAADTPAVSFIVLLAGSTVPGDAILAEQRRLIERAAGATDAQIAQGETIVAPLTAIAKTTPDAAARKAKLAAERAAIVKSFPPNQRAAAGAEAAQVIQSLDSPWMRYFLQYDPRPVLEKVKCPVLAINGANDLQVPPQQNLPVIATALKAAGNTDVTTRELPGLNHLFQHSKTGAPSDYADISETFAPEALAVVGDWIAAHTTAAKKP